MAIKVDREVRPDIDDAYMVAVQMMTGAGGWPMTVWLTPDRAPFYAGTYFPPRDGGRGRQAGFLTVLRQMRTALKEHATDITSRAAELKNRIAILSAPPRASEAPGRAVLRAGFASYESSFDATNGGFGRSPKFPTPTALDFLLRYHRHTGSARALEMVTRTLERMAAGGIHDQLGGGFHRYATDAAWQVPHFEKMLYDNAQLARVYLDAFQVTGRGDFAAVARDILDYVAREMTTPDGAFWSATDADSAGEEGRFFVWTQAEVRAALDPRSATAVIAHFGIRDPGPFDGRNILHVARPLEAVATDLAITPAEGRQVLAAARGTLLDARGKRTPPHTDTKVLTAWNGLMVSAFARGGAVLKEPRSVAAAERAARFSLERLRDGQHLKRSFAAGAAHGDGFLEDYAFLAAGLLDLYQTTFDPAWLQSAIGLHEVLSREFHDPDLGGFFQTGTTRDPSIVRQKPDSDGALPSGNAVATGNLLRLAELTGADRWRAQADETLRAVSDSLAQAPTSAPALLSAIDMRLDQTKEIVIVLPPTGADDANLVAVVRSTYLPNDIVLVAREGEDLARQEALVPLFADKRALRGVATAYVCKQQVCDLPTSDPTQLSTQLRQVQPLEP